MLKRLYDRTMELSAHRHAMAALALVAFAESSFFPIPPDILLIPMVLAARDKAWRIAALCTAASVIGGLAGYGIGAFFFEALGKPVLEAYNALAKFEEFRALYNENGILIVFTAGFSPIPYKIFTIASGFTGLDPVSFVIASLVSRGARFFIVAGLLWRFGDPIRLFIERHLGKLTVAFSVLLIGSFVLLKYFL